MNDINLSILAYCDDIVIISPSVGHMEILLKVCEEFSACWKIEFNANKSVALTVQKKKANDLPCFKLNNLEIPHSLNVEYLGLPIGDNDFISQYLEEKWQKILFALWAWFKI